jgi:CheY-like chemotaxis protein
MQMPGMDGFELAAAIRSEAAIADARLILLTSVDGVGDGEAARRLGFSAYLHKPVRHRQLHRTICTTLGIGTPTAPRPAHAALDPSGASASSRGRYRVLVAEDNSVNQMVISRILQKLGYRADVVANGIEAICTLEQAPYDAILMDCQMPEMDGYEAATRIRAIEGTGRRTPIIALTAAVLQEDRERCRAAGMDDFLPKPVTHESVRATLERWVRDSRPPGSDFPDTPQERVGDAFDGEPAGAPA